MVKMDASLDDIIQRKHNRKTNNNFRSNRNGFPKRLLGRTSNRNQVIRKDLKGVQKQSRNVTDARTKIVFKQRAKIKDARDRLNVIAKQTDARQRLLQLKAIRSGSSLAKSPLPSPRAMDKTRMPKSRAQNMLNTIQKQLNPTSPLRRPHVNTMSPSMNITRTVPGGRNFGGRLNRAKPSVPFTADGKSVVVGSGNIYVTTANEEARFGRYDEDDPMAESEYDSTNGMPSYRHLQEPIPALPVVSRISADLQSRLSPLRNELGPTQGYKVTVANLQPAVTQHDIVELFSEIGVLRKAILVRPGLAEVIFQKSVDAEKACSVYHNRELDGKPMWVTLATPSPSGSAQRFMPTPSTPWTSGSSLRSDRMPPSGRSLVAPDAEIVRSALFRKRISSVIPSKKPTFTITL